MMRASLLSIAGALLQFAAPGLAADRIPAELASYFWAREPLHALFGDIAVSGPTKNVLENQTQVMPDLVVSSRMPYKPPFLFMIVDPDSANSESTGNLSVTLHTLVSAVTEENYYAVNQSRLYPSNSDVLAPYIGPEQSTTEPSHNYTLFLFAQPASVDISSEWQSHLDATDLAGRANFPLGDFVSQLGLGQPICAMCFRLKQIKAATVASAPQSTSRPTQTPTPTHTTTPTSTATSTSSPTQTLSHSPSVVPLISSKSTHAVTTTPTPLVVPSETARAVAWPWTNSTLNSTSGPAQSQNVTINRSSGSERLGVSGVLLGWVFILAAVMFSL